MWSRFSEADVAAYAARHPEVAARCADGGIDALTPEEVAEILAEKRKTVGRFLAEQRNKRRAERGLPPEGSIGAKPKKPKLSPEELLAVKRAAIAKFWAEHQEIRERAAAKRAAKEAERLARKEANAEMRNRQCNKAVVGYLENAGTDTPIRFISATAAAQHFVSIGRAKSLAAVKIGICNVIHGRRKSAFGYVWKFA